MTKKELDVFIRKNAGRSRVDTRNVVENTPYSSRKWFYVYKLCDIKMSLKKTRPRLYNLRAAALKRSMETASSLGDWLFIAANVQGPYRESAVIEVMKYLILIKKVVAYCSSFARHSHVVVLINLVSYPI